MACGASPHPASVVAMGPGDYLAVLAVWLVAIMAPGPDVVLVLRQTIRGGRPAGVAAAAGIAVGIVAWIALAMVGAHVLLDADDRVLGGLQLAGGAYLVVLGIAGVRAALMPGGAHEFELAQLGVDAAAAGGRGGRGGPGRGPDGEPSVGGVSGLAGGIAVADPLPATASDHLARRSFGLGLATNLSNPKALVFFGSVFTVLIPETATTADRVALSVLLVAIEAAWFSGLAMAASAGRVGELLGRHAARLDTIAAVAFIVLGLVSAATGAAAFV